MTPHRLLTALVAASLAGCAPEPNPRVHGSDIEVHGNWVISVVEATGEVVSRHEFDNAYTDPTGILQQLLAGETIVAGWGVFLWSPNASQGICDDNGARFGYCVIVPSGIVPEAEYRFPTLTTETSGPDLVLTGSAVATHAGTVDRVQTVVATCAPGTVDCSTGWLWVSAEQFTEHLFAAPDVIPVAAGQQAKVDVTISFATSP